METSSGTRHHAVNQITGDDNKYKDSGAPQTTSYPSENVLRKEIPRPCAVIGPGVIPSYHRVDSYMPHIWPQSAVSDGSPAYYRHPQVQFCSDRAYPPRNISPRHTFQENMNRIIVPSPSEVKFRNYGGASQSGPPILPESTKPNILPDTKFCDESVLVNPRSVDLIRSQYNRNNDVPLRHEAPGAAVPQYTVHGYPVSKIHNASASPYSNVYNCPEFQRYPLEYQNPGIQLVKNNQIYQKLPEQSSFLVANEYPGSKYSRVNNIRYEPYPPIKDKYIQSRFDYPYPYSNQYPSGYSSVAKCNDLRKRNIIPPDMKYYQMPQKYIEAHAILPNSDFRPKISARRSQYRLADIPAHSMDPYVAHMPQGKVYGLDICDKNNQYAVNPRTIPESSKLRIDYYNHYRGLPYPDRQLLNESMQSQNCNKSIYAYPMKPPDVSNSYSLSNVNYQKSGEEQHDRISEYDAMNNHKFYYGSYNPLAKIPTEFSPNIISPTESSTSFDSLHTVSHQLYQEDGGYVSQCSTTSGKSADYQLMKNSNDKQLYHESNRHVNNMANFVTSNNPERECEKSSIKSRNMKSSMDLRQFLEMWDEEFEDSKVVKTHSEANNKIDNGYPNCPQFVSDNPTMPASEQLYVLDKVNIADGDLHKYEHLQKVTELPGNIKDCEQADNIKKSISKLNSQSGTNNPLHYLNVKKDKVNGNVKPSHNVQESAYNISTSELVDVEAKISQSIIHKDVGCNFEIKPCSPGRPVQMKVEIKNDFNNHSIDANKRKHYTNQIAHTNKMQPLEFFNVYESKEKLSKNNYNSNNKAIVDIRNSPFMPVSDFTSRKTCYIDTSLPPIDSPVASALCTNENRETVLHKTNYDANRNIEIKSESSKTVISSTLGAHKESSFMDVGPPNLFGPEKNCELAGDMQFKNTGKAYHPSQEEIDVGVEMCPKGYEGFLEKLKLKTNKVLGNINDVNQFKPDGILAKNKEFIRNCNSTTPPLKCFKNLFETSDPKIDFQLSKELTKIGEDNIKVNDAVKIAKTIDFDSKAENYQMGSQKLDIPGEIEALNLSPKEEQKCKNPKVVKENKKSTLISEKTNGTLIFGDLPNIHTDSENKDGMVLMNVPCSIQTHQILKSTFPIPEKSAQPIKDIYNGETENSATCLKVLDKPQEVVSTPHILLGEKFANNLSLNIKESKLSDKADNLLGLKNLTSVDGLEIQNCSGELHNIPILNVCLGDVVSINTVKECDLLKFDPLLESSYINNKDIVKPSCNEGVPSTKIAVEKYNSVSHIETTTTNFIECDKIEKFDTICVSVIKDVKSNQPFSDANIKVNNDFVKKIEKSRSNISVSKQKNVSASHSRNVSDNNLDFKLDRSRSYNVENETKVSNVILKSHLIHIDEVETSVQMMSGRIKEHIIHESIPTNTSNNLNNLDSNLDESMNYNEKESKMPDDISKPHYIHIEGVERNMPRRIKKNIRYDPDSDVNKLCPDPKESTSYNEEVISKPQSVYIEDTEETMCGTQENITHTVDDSEVELKNLHSNLQMSASHTDDIKIQDVPSKPHLIHIKESKETTSEGIQEKIYSSIDTVKDIDNRNSNLDKSISYNENETTVHNENFKPHSINIEEVEETMCEGVQENTLYVSSSTDDYSKDLKNISSIEMNSINCNINETIVQDEILKLNSIHTELEETTCDGIQQNIMYASDSIDESDKNLKNIDSNPIKPIRCNETETTLHDDILKLHSTHIEALEEVVCDSVQKNIMYALDSIDDSDRDLKNIDSDPIKPICCKENDSTILDDTLKSHSIHIEAVEETMCDRVQENIMYACDSIDDSDRDSKNSDSNPIKSICCSENETTKQDKIVKLHSNHIEAIEETMCDRVQENIINTSDSIDDSDKDLNNIDSKPIKSIFFNENKTTVQNHILESHSIHIEKIEETMCDKVQENIMYASDTINDPYKELKNIDSNSIKSICCNENETTIQDDILESHSIHIEEIEETMCDKVQENIMYASDTIDDPDKELKNNDSNSIKSICCNENETTIQDDILESRSIHIEEVEETMCDKVQENIMYASDSIDDPDKDLKNIDSNSIKSICCNENEIIKQDDILESRSIHIEEVEETMCDRVQENIMNPSDSIDDSDKDLKNIDSNLIKSIFCNENKTTVQNHILESHSIHIEEIEETMCDKVQENIMYASDTIDDPDKELKNNDSNSIKSICCNENETTIQDDILESHSNHIEEVEETVCDGQESVMDKSVQESTMYASSSADSNINFSNLDSNLDKSTSCNENETIVHDEILKPQSILIEEINESMSATVQENVSYASLNDDSDCTVNNIDSKADESTNCYENETKMQDMCLKPNSIYIEETEEIVTDRMQENVKCMSYFNDSDNKINSFVSNPDESKSEIKMQDIIIKPHLIHVEEVAEITSDSIQEDVRDTSTFIGDSVSDNNLDSNPDDSTSYTKSETKMHDINLKSHLIHICEVEDIISDEIQENTPNPMDEAILKSRSVPVKESDETMCDTIQENKMCRLQSSARLYADKLTSDNESKTQMQDVIVNSCLINNEEAICGIQENAREVSNSVNDSDSDVDNLVSNTEESTSSNINERKIEEVLTKKFVMHIEEEKIESDRKKINAIHASNKLQKQDVILKSHLIPIEDTENATNTCIPIHDFDSNLNKLESNMEESKSSIHIEETEDTISDVTKENIKCILIMHDSDGDVNNIDSHPDELISYDTEYETRQQDVSLKPKFIDIQEVDETTPKTSDNVQKDISNSTNDSDIDCDSKQDDLTCLSIANVINIRDHVIPKQALYSSEAENNMSPKNNEKLEGEKYELNRVLITEFDNDLIRHNDIPLTSDNNKNELTGIVFEDNSEKYRKYKFFKKKGNDCVKMFDENKKLALIHSNHKSERPSSPQYFEETGSTVILSGDIEENCTEKLLSLSCGDTLVSVDHTFSVNASEESVNRSDTLLEISILETREEICISNIKNIVLGSQLHSVELSAQPGTEELDEIVSANENVLLYEIQSPVSSSYDAQMENVVSSDTVESLYVTNSRTSNERDIAENNVSALNEMIEDTKIDENVGGCWIEDIACVETVVSEETIFQSEDEIATAASPLDISWGPNTSDSEADESVPYSVQHKPDCTGEIFKDSNSNFILKNCKLELIKLPDRMSLEENESHGLRSFTGAQSKKTKSLKLLAVNSTDSIKKRNRPAIIHDEGKNEISRKKIKLDDTAIKETLVNKCVGKIQKIPSLNTRSNLFSKGKLITKGAQKYIPPDDTHNHKLKCQLPLPENILLSLSKHNLRNTERSKSRHKTSAKVDKQGHARSQNKLPKKKSKPNFEDVLKQIDETNISWSKKKLKRCLNSNKSIPKMIIKKNETGCHYTSIPGKKTRTPDLTGNKWQPWVCLQRNVNIEKMVKTKSVRAIFFNYSPQTKDHTFCQRDNGKCKNCKTIKNCNKGRLPKSLPSRALDFIL